ncbi:hypothetical protein M0R04_09115 [Candidatus Dojkabacteria bacterium]|jgi:hypothetical protein|nr:hypothetical protein [Candidatus Dojkabacteria bacterium]
MDDPVLKNQIESLILKGFNKEEIKSLLKITDDKLINKCIKDSINANIDDNSIKLYSELQKDLSKLVFTEMQGKEKRDPNVILNAVKLQAELQEKKLVLNKNSIKVKGSFNPSKISKDYIYERDAEIVKLKEQGIPNKDIADKFSISEMSILWATDRHSLNLPEHLKTLSPSIVTETKGLSRDERIRLLQKAYDDKLTKMNVRELVNSIKNNSERHRPPLIVNKTNKTKQEKLNGN